MKSKLLNFYIVSIILTSTACAPKSENEAETMTTKAVNAQGKIKLFVYKGCPWCNKVIAYLQQTGHLDDITIMDLSNPENMKELKSLNNYNTQAPYLLDEQKGVGMLESADIINYFKTRF
jgi:glutaredoxin